MIDFLEQNKDITFFSAFRTRACAKYFMQINTIEDIDKLKEIIKWTKGKNIKYEFIWWGTNMLFAFDEFDGVIIRNNLKSKDLELQNKKLKIYSGDNVINTTRKLIDLWENKLAPFLGLPGTFGWAIAWNAWCFGLEIKDILVEADLLDLENLEIIKFFNEDFSFEYRNSSIKWKKRYLVISAILDISGASDVEDINFSLEKRKKTQPWGATCGSFFKNPIGDYSGRLIESVWLKWYKIWWAKISEKHANFFINQDDATYTDILALRDLAREKVMKEFGINLEEEVRIIT